MALRPKRSSWAVFGADYSAKDRPLGYVNARDPSEAMNKASKKWPGKPLRVQRKTEDPNLGESSSGLAVAIPPDVEFADLSLRREAGGALSFDWSPIERICEASGLAISLFRDAPEDNVAALIAAWYALHLRRGGDSNAAAEELIAEAQAEIEGGQNISYPAGHA